MDLFPNVDQTLVNYLLLPLLIFFARVADVTLGTLRFAFLAKGNKIIAPLLGFLEVFILIIAISQVMNNLNSFASYFAWAGGFAMGNYVGIWIEEKLAFGERVVRVFTTKPAIALLEQLHEMGYPITQMDAAGTRGKVNILFSIIKRKDLQKVLELVEKCHPKAFYTVEEVRMMSKDLSQRGASPSSAPRGLMSMHTLRRLNPLRRAA